MSDIGSSSLSLLREGSFQKSKTRTCQMSSAWWGLVTSRTAAVAARCASLWRVILAIRQKQRGGCEECKRDRVERLPQQARSVPPIRPLIGHGCSWGEEVLPIGDNWCFVAGPSWPDKNLTFIGNKIAPRVWKGDSWPKKRPLCYNILQRNHGKAKQPKLNFSFVFLK